MKLRGRLILICTSLALLSCQVIQSLVATAPTSAGPVASLPVTVTLPTAYPTGIASPPATGRLETNPPPSISATLPAPPSALPGASPPASLLTAGDPFIPGLGNQGYDIQHYNLQLTLAPQDQNLRAEATLQASVTQPPLAWIALDFAGFEIDRLTLDGLPAPYTRQGEKLIIAPASPLPAGANFSLAVAYHGLPSHRASRYAPFISSLGLQYRENNVYAVGEPEGAHFWFPCNDHPRDKATFTIEITVPSGMVGAASGLLVDHLSGLSLPNGGAADRYTWEQRAPMATYLATVAVGKYQILEGRSPQGTKRWDAVFPDMQADFEASAGQVDQSLDWMSDLFGPYPFESFGYVTVRGFGASLETQSLVLLDENAAQETTMVHEMAHMWFGDWVSLDSWNEVWRNEGFATYVSLMWADRKRPGILEKSIAEYQAALEASPVNYPLDEPPPGEMFGRSSYVGGAVLVHALRHEMGDQAFFQGLRDYFQEYGGKSASQAQFQAVMESAAGHPLDQFFQAQFNRYSRP